MRITFKWEREEIIILIFLLFLKEKKGTSTRKVDTRNIHDTDTVWVIKCIDDRCIDRKTRYNADFKLSQHYLNRECKIILGLEKQEFN
jgi:hypothetical protein